MVSVNTLAERKTDFRVGDWIMDSGAFTRIASGRGHLLVDLYAKLIQRWARCGKLLAAVAQDFMCEPFTIARTGLSVEEHQRLTVEYYDTLLSVMPASIEVHDSVRNHAHLVARRPQDDNVRNHTPVYIMPVIQGFRVHEYLRHIDLYGDRLHESMWVGVGSVCKRNGNIGVVLEVLASIKSKRPDLRLHGFGLKQTALESSEIWELLYSCDSMAYSYSKRFGAPESEEELADRYMEKIEAAMNDQAIKKIPHTAGANGMQGRKPKWNSPTKAIRIPAKYADRLLALTRKWEQEGEEEEGEEAGTASIKETYL